MSIFGSLITLFRTSGFKAKVGSLSLFALGGGVHIRSRRFPSGATPLMG